MGSHLFHPETLDLVQITSLPHRRHSGNIDSTLWKGTSHFSYPSGIAKKKKSFQIKSQTKHFHYNIQKGSINWNQNWVRIWIYKCEFLISTSKFRIIKYLFQRSSFQCLERFYVIEISSSLYIFNFLFYWCLFFIR